LPVGIFSDPKSQIWFNFAGLGMENLGIYILLPAAPGIARNRINEL
jgi:hypothetical protein